MFAAELLDRADALSRRIGSQMGGRSVGRTWRDHICGTFQFISLQHHAALVYLLRDGRLPSATALVRPQYEAHLRGMWLLTEATDAEFERFTGEGRLPTTEDMVERLKGRSLALRVVKDLIWKRMCDYTHTGLSQLSRNIGETSIGFNYDTGELEAMLHASNALAMLAGDLLAAMTGDRDLRQKFETDAVAELREANAAFED